MRNVFTQYLVERAIRDEDVYLLTGDLGFSFFENFQERFPDRFINAGIAEQNMIGVAAGLAMAGKKVFVYSIIPFLTMRCFEQIRIDLCYHSLPVVLVGNGGGFSYGQAGLTHQGIEDLAIMRALAGMTIIAPADKRELHMLLPQLTSVSGPVYLRLSNYDEIPQELMNYDVCLGKACEVIPDNDILIITTGNSLDLGHSVCRSLLDHGIVSGLVSMPTLKPFDRSFFYQKENLKAVFTIEEHSIIGGLGDTVAKMLCDDFHHKITFKAFGFPDSFLHVVGSRHYLRNLVGLNVGEITKEIFKKLCSCKNI